MEFNKRNNLNYNDLNSKFVKTMIQKINSNLFYKGITVIVFNTIINTSFKEELNIKIISVMNNKDAFKKAVLNNKDANTLYLFNEDDSWSKQFNYVFQFINTSHFVLVDDINDLSISAIDDIETGNTYIIKRSSNAYSANIMNHIFYESNLEETEINNSVELEKISDINSQSDINLENKGNELIEAIHPLLIKLDFTPKADLNELKINSSVVYPLENDLIKLNTFKGILFPTESFSKIKFEGQSFNDTLLVAVTEFLASNAINVMSTDALIYSGVDTLNVYADDLISTLSLLNDLLNKRTSEDVVRYVQYVVDNLLQGISNDYKEDIKQLNELIYTLHDADFDNLSIEVLNKGMADELVIAYCFPPYNDTSGNVMAKRIYSEQNKVDIISNVMDRIRKKDYSLNGIANEYIDTKFLMKAPQAFSSYQSISEFTEQGLEVYQLYKDKYKKLYSRAMFPASHFLAYQIKVENNALYWRAEFSDPLLTDVSSNERYSPIKDEAFVGKIKNELNPGYAELVDDNVFNLCELLPLSHADELIFTNEHQLEYIIKRFNDDIKQSIRERAVISKHPTLPKQFYEKEISYYKVDEKKINLAYFGNFYDTRGFREIELFCKYLNLSGITNFVIHVFTNLNSKVTKMVQNSSFSQHIILNPYLDYFEFLNLTNKMDILMIYDARTIGIKEVNPYLPSKLSDYLGSKAMTLAFIEENSILSQQKDDKLYLVNMNEFHNYSKIITKMSERLNKSLN